MHGAADVEPMAVTRDGARRKTALADIVVLMVATDSVVAARQLAPRP